MDELVQWLGVQLDEDERIAREASGGTVVGEPGAWQPSPHGDEWEASGSAGEDEELMVALRPGLPRPPDVMSGLWGAVFSHRMDDSDPDADSPMRAFEHAARHDPARVLREIDAKRQLLADFAPMLAQTDAAIDSEWNSNDDLHGRLLAYLALAYVDLPGYREEWRP